MAINLTQIQSLTQPGLDEVFGMYHDLPEQWKEFYSVYESDKAQEQDIEMKLLGPAAFKADGGPVAVDTMGQRYTTTFVHQYVGNSFGITRQAIKDNLYKTQFPMITQALKKSMRVAKNILSVVPLNTAFAGGTIIGDGQVLCSAAHPYDGGTFTNLGTVQFSEQGLEQMLIGIQAFKDAAGNIISAKGKKLVIPSALQFQAQRLLGSEFRPGTANNDINAIKSLQAIPESYTVNHYLTNANAYFLFTDVEDCFKHFIREKLETSSYCDFDTDTVRHKVIERYSFGVNNPRGVYGYAP